MNKLGNIDIDKLEQLKADLFERGSDPLMSDAFLMIQQLESTIVTMTLNHKHYCEWAASEILRYQNKSIDASWAANPDRSGGQFTQDEIEHSRNGGW